MPPLGLSVSISRPSLGRELNSTSSSQASSSSSSSVMQTSFSEEDNRSTLGGGRELSGIALNEQVLNDDIDILKKLAKQSILYKSGEQDVVYKEYTSVIMTHVRQIFRMVKFFSDSKELYNEPDFVTEAGLKRQTVKICHMLFRQMKKRNDHGTFIENVKFWKATRKIVKNQLHKMRHSDINSFKKKFTQGEYFEDRCCISMLSHCNFLD